MLKQYMNVTEKHQIQFTNEKKRSERRKHCALADPKIFAQPQTPFSGAQDGQNLISCMEMGAACS